MNIWEDHIEGLTKQVALQRAKLEELENRCDYYEEVLYTLLSALVNSGIIVQDPDGEHNMPS
tara:strand:+ start:246 stop:431 length:186 start_codon:yes stop_codon:yes gene_type:complete